LCVPPLPSLPPNLPLSCRLTCRHYYSLPGHIALPRCLSDKPPTPYRRQTNKHLLLKPDLIPL
ncbi:hypothetical protein A2U01_0105158, partial [Trifolium medium]|nr:hypothetical protein [Trifolium medium]